MSSKKKGNKKFPKPVRKALAAGNILPASAIGKKYPKRVRKQAKAFVAQKVEKDAPRGPYAYGEDPRFGGDALSAITKLMEEAAMVCKAEAAEARQREEVKRQEALLWPNWYGDTPDRKVKSVSLMNIGPGLYGKA